MKTRDDILLETKDLTFKGHPHLQGSQLPETAHERRRLLALLAYVWRVPKIENQALYFNAHNLKIEDMTPFEIVLRKAFAAERKRRLSAERKLKILLA